MDENVPPYGVASFREADAGSILKLDVGLQRPVQGIPGSERAKLQTASMLLGPPLDVMRAGLVTGDSARTQPRQV